MNSYRSVHSVFSRRLRPGARRVDGRPRVWVSPVDGEVCAFDTITADLLPQAKGKSYSLGALIADPERIDTYLGGSCLVVYLAPRDYHGVHSPSSGSIVRCAYVPGTLFPVRRWAVRTIDRLYTRNERMVVEIQTESRGRMVVVWVGATFVGGIRPAFARLWDEPPSRTHWRFAGIPVVKGDRLGSFEFGSTVIVVTEHPVDRWVGVGERLRVGQAAGAWAHDRKGNGVHPSGPS